MFKLFAAIFRNIVASRAPSASKFLKGKGLKPSLENFRQTMLFDQKGIVTTDGASLLQVPYPDDYVPPKALIGKALDVRDAKATALTFREHARKLRARIEAAP